MFFTRRYVILFWVFFAWETVEICIGSTDQVLYRRQDNTYLRNHVIRKLLVKSEIECGSHCAREQSCSSVNFQVMNDGPDTCELNAATENGLVGSDLLTKEGATFLKIVYRSCQRSETFSQRSGKCIRPASCKAALKKDSSLSSAAYTLQVNETSPQYPVYCHMTEIPGCGGGGWTLILKVNGSKQTFAFNSPYWTNKDVYGISDGQLGLSGGETMLASYWNNPFTKICLGMKDNSVTGWIKLDYNGSSMYSLIADNVYRQTNLGKAVWKSVLVGSSLQENCRLEGFNLNVIGAYQSNVRLGLLANNENNCLSPDSWIGFGAQGSFCNQQHSLACGNGAICGSPDNGQKLIKAFGYILVQ